MICYKITNKINNKVYIGITKCSLKRRWTQHKSKSKKSNNHLYKSIRKYGIENFNIEVINTFNSEKDMYDFEIYCIKKYKSNNRLFGYNHSTGGESSSKGRVLSKETKLKISLYQKTRIRNKHSEETKIKMSNSAKGRDMSKAYKASAKNNKGKKSINRRKVILDKKYLFNSITEASDKTGVLIGSIHNNIKGLTKKTKVGVWEYYK